MILIIRPIKDSLILMNLPSQVFQMYEDLTLGNTYIQYKFGITCPEYFRTC